MKLKPENVVAGAVRAILWAVGSCEAVEEPLPKRIPKSLEEDDEEDEQLEASAQAGRSHEFKGAAVYRMGRMS